MQIASLSKGIDLSAHNEVTPSLDGLDFIFARATYGTVFDHLYPHHILKARKRGLITGAYHFGTIATHGYVQAREFLRAAGVVDLYVLDLEKERGKARMTDDQARDFIRAVKADGKQCGLYHSLDGFPSLGQNWNWVAYWSNTPPNIPWNFWQYRGGPIDLDRFSGDRIAMRTFAGHPRPTPLIIYRVKAGDSLSRICAIWHVPGGWWALYKLNRAKIGDNPNLIHPGLLLKLPAGSHR